LLTDEQILRLLITPIGVALLTPVYHSLFCKLRGPGRAVDAETLDGVADGGGPTTVHQPAYHRLTGPRVES
jgi:hypothetical protein